MREKDMFLKKNKLFFFVFILCLNFLFLKSAFPKNEEIINYLNGLDSFSVSFIQNDGFNLSEGEISIGMNRVRVDYYTPSKILIILDKSKAMYYNYDLDEDEFFDPKNTSAWFFFEIFNNPSFFKNSELIYEDNNILIETNGTNRDEIYKLKLHFENKPLLIRKIELLIGDSNLTLSIFDHSHNREFDKNFFKLINPTFFN